MSVKIGEASPKGRMDLPPRGGGGGNMRGGAVGFPGAGFDSHFGPMGFGGTQGGFSGRLWVFNKKNLLNDLAETVIGNRLLCPLCHLLP